MKLGFIGLGRMGREMVLRFLEQGIDVVVFNRSSKKTKELEKEYIGISIKYFGEKDKNSLNTKYQPLNTIGKLAPCYSISEFVSKLEQPRIAWLMVEHGKPVDEMIGKLLEAGIEKGDILIDGGNSFYKDSIRRYELLKSKGIHFLDVGTSGGLEGARHGACLMIGGDRTIYDKARPLFEAVACPGGYEYFGQAGAGHFVKMVHNGVEYGMLQAIGEGFEILEKGPYKLNLQKIAFNWMHGSVVRGWLMELLERALREDKGNRGNKGDWLDGISGVIGGGQTGEWTKETAEELGVEIPVIKKSLEARKKSLDTPTFSGKVVAALRREFGGHEVKLK